MSKKKTRTRRQHLDAARRLQQRINTQMRVLDDETTTDAQVTAAVGIMAADIAVLAFIDDNVPSRNPADDS